MRSFGTAECIARSDSPTNQSRRFPMNRKLNRKELRSKLAEMVTDLGVIISGVSEQTRELKELVRFRNELKELAAKVDCDKEIDWPLVISLMVRFTHFIYLFSSK
jgi:hypothetical protein